MCRKSLTQTEGQSPRGTEPVCCEWQSPPDAISLAPGEVHLWLAILEVSDVVFSRLCASLSDDPQNALSRSATWGIGACTGSLAASFVTSYPATSFARPNPRISASTNLAGPNSAAEWSQATCISALHAPVASPRMQL